MYRRKFLFSLADVFKYSVVVFTYEGFTSAIESRKYMLLYNSIYFLKDGEPLIIIIYSFMYSTNVHRYVILTSKLEPVWV